MVNFPISSSTSAVFFLASVSINAPPIIPLTPFCTFSYFCAISFITSLESSMMVRLSNVSVVLWFSSVSSLSSISLYSSSSSFSFCPLLLYSGKLFSYEKNVKRTKQSHLHQKAYVKTFSFSLFCF